MKKRIIFITLILAILISIFTISFGSVKLNSSHVFQMIINKILGIDFFEQAWRNSSQNIVINLRIPRVLLAFITGGALSIIGILMQTLTKNTLAEPYVLGISSGASTGAVAIIIFGSTPLLKFLSVRQGAFIGSLISIMIVFGITAGKRFSNTHLILTGVGVSAFFMACTTFIIFSGTNPSQIISAMFWMTGSLSTASWDKIFMPGILLLFTVILAYLFSYELDILLFGNNTAKSLGINTIFLKVGIILISTLLVSSIVSITGIIGFVGLVIPHIGRKIIGYNHKHLCIFSILLGGTFLVIADTFARTAFSPEEIPIGVVTAFCGSPLFIWIIRRNYSFGGRE